MNRKKICTQKKVTGVVALLVALAIILTGTFAWKDFSQSALSLFSADASSKHWVSLVDDFQSATDASTKTLTDWKRGDISTKKVYVTSNPEDDKATLIGYNSQYDAEYKPVFVRVKLLQTLTIGGEIIDPVAGINVSSNQFPTQIQWAKDGTIKTIDEWVAGGSLRGPYWILDDSGWLYWAQPLAFDETTTHLLDSVKLLIEPEKELEYTVNVKLEAVSDDLDSTTGTGDYLGGFANWSIADTARIMPLFKDMSYSYHIGYETLIMKSGDIQQFTLSMSPSNKLMPTATWSSNNETVATVDSTGLVSALTSGTATITATVDGQTVSATVEVTAAETFAFTIDTSLGTKGNTVTLAINSATGNNLVIDWGDSTISSTLTGTIAVADRTHTYAEAKEYTVKITGDMPSSMTFSGETRLTSVQSGFLENTALSMQSYFENCTNLKTIPGNLFAKSAAVTSFLNTFMNCSSLTGSIPEDLFKANTEVIFFTSIFYGCSSLTGSIPAGLFDAAGNKVTSFINAFYDCRSLTGSIPVDLFKANTEVTSFTSVFKGCNSLTGSIPVDLFKTNSAVTSFYQTFLACNGLTSIPAGLFDNNPEVTNFYGTFVGCNVTSIPADLFKNNIKVTNFEATFLVCNGLISIPAGLFDYNTKVTNFYRTFQNCTGLTSIPADLFKNNTAVINFNNTFNGCSTIIGNLPELWISHSSVLVENHIGTFTGCTQATNHQDAINNEWATE